MEGVAVISSDNETTHPDYIGWVVLSVILATTTIVFLMLWIFSQPINSSSSTSTSCFGPFGVQSGVDANPINSCGVNRNNPCIFTINTLSGAQDQCNTLQSICNAFTFNQNTNTMKIVQPTNTFTSLATNLFVRQVDTVS